MMWTDERIAAAVARLSADPSSSSIELLLESMRDDYEANIAALVAYNRNLVDETNQHMARIKVLEAERREQSQRKYY